MDKKTAFLLILILFGWVLIYLSHNFLIYTIKAPVAIAFVDPAIHGSVSFLLLLPFYFFQKVNTQMFIIGVSFGILIDVDHAVAAHSINIKAMLSLPARPITHSVLFAGIICILLTPFLYYYNRRLVPWLLIFYVSFLSLISHVFRDAIDSCMTPWAYPLESFPISQLSFFIAFIVINLFNISLARKGQSSNFLI